MQWSGAGISFLLHPGGNLGVPTHIGRSILNTSRISWWGVEQEGKRRAHWRNCISFVTLTLYCCYLVIAFATRTLILQIYKCFFVFPGM